MLKNSFNISVSLLVFATACTQQPAQIVLKGQESFGRDIRSGYADRPSHTVSNSSSVVASYGSSYISENTEQKAAISSIDVSDLSPPLEDKSEEKKEQAQADDKAEPTVKTTLNPWTNKPREIDDEKIVAKSSTPVKSEEKKPKNLYDNVKTNNVSEMKWPVASKKIISSFGSKGAGKANDGINIASAEGEPVWAAADGQVVHVSSEMKGYGNMVFIKHSGKITTSYAHLSRITVDKYARVKRGDIIGYVGSTGNVKTSQLFFSLHKGKEAIDPQKYIKNDLAGL